MLQNYIREGSNPDHADYDGDGVVDGQDTPYIATRIGADKNQGKSKGRARQADRAAGPPKGGVSKLTPEPKRRLFAYDQWRLLGAYDGAGKAVQETVWLNNIPIATVRDGKVYYVHSDHLGTPRAISDPATGTEVWRWSSDPFGKAQANGDPDGDGEVFIYNLRFPGQYYDAETGKHYNYFRNYEPGIGRYVQPDPIGLKGKDSNLYGYVVNDPVNRLDPRGLENIPFGAEVNQAPPAGAVYAKQQVEDARAEANAKGTCMVQCLGSGAAEMVGGEFAARGASRGAEKAGSKLIEKGASTAGKLCKVGAKRVIPGLNLVATGQTIGNTAGCVSLCF